MLAPALARTALRRAVLTLALLPAAVLLVLLATSAAAEERVVTITADGVRPAVLQAEPGDTVRFVNEDRTFAYRAQSTGGPWRFDSGPTRLLDGDFVVPAPLVRAGSYAYRVAQDAPYRGRVVVGDGTGVAPTGVPSVVPVPPGTPSAPAGPVPTPSGAVPSGGVPSAPAASVSPTAGPAVVDGTLPGPPTGRALGLPTAVAAVLLVGAASLLLRLLLAEPVLSDPSARLQAAAHDSGGGSPRW